MHLGNLRIYRVEVIAGIFALKTVMNNRATRCDLLQTFHQ